MGEVLGHLDDGTQLFGEQRAGQFVTVGGQGVQAQGQAAVTGKGHFHHGGDEATIGTVVVGQQQAILVEALDHREEGLEVFGLVDVGSLLAELAMGLGEDGAAQAILATTQVDEDQVGLALVQAQLGGQGAADVLHRGEAGDHQRKRRGDALVFAAVLPAGLHGHGVLADRDGDAQLRAQLHAYRLDGFIKARIFTRVAGGGHPVGGELDVAELLDARSGQVGDGLADGHAAGSGRVEQRQRGALAHGHGFAGVDVEAGGGHGAVGYRDLPGADHLVAGDQAGDGAVADGDQEALAGHRRVTQHTLDRLGQVQAGAVEGVAQFGFTGRAAVHARRLAEQDVQRHVHGVVAEVAVGHGQLALLGGLADHGEGTTLAFADGLEGLEVLGVHGEHVALLGLVAPDLQRAHARLVVRHVAQLEAAAATGIVDQFGEGVGQAARTHVVDEGDGVVFTQLPAAVDDLLAAALHFRVLALHRGEIQVGGAGAGGHGRGRATAQADQHGRTAQHDELAAHRDVALLHVVGADVAQAAGEHDRLVVATHLGTTRGLDLLLEGAEVAGQGRTTEFVVEGGAAQRAFDHDIQRGDDALGLAVGLLPGLLETGDVQVGDGEAGQAGLGLGAATSGTFVADLTAGASGGAGERGDGGRVVVGLHLHQDVHGLAVRPVFAGLGVGVEAPGGEAFHDRGVVLVGGQHTGAVHLVGVLDHAEQRLLLAFAVDVPAGIEDLVPAVLGVGLGEHHEFDVMGIAPQGGEALDQVVDLVLGQGQAQLQIGLLQGSVTTAEHVHRSERLGRGMAEDVGGGVQGRQHALGHAVMQGRGQLLVGSGVQLAGDVVRHAALQTLDLRQATVVGDVGGLARPGRNGAQAGHDQEQRAAGFLLGDAGAVLQQSAEDALFLRAQGAGDFGEMNELGIEPGYTGNQASQLVEKFAVTERRKSGSAAQDQHRGQPRGQVTLGPCILD